MQVSTFSKIKRKLAAAASVETWRDLLGCTASFAGVEPHLAAAVDWMTHSIQATNGQGFAAHYRIGKGWGSGYPETTGYILPTLLCLSEKRGRRDLEKAAIQQAEWLLTTQLPSGGFPGGEIQLGLEETVFNTGQILRGLIAAWEKSGNSKFQDSALRGATWLLSVQDPDGAWRRFTSPLTPAKEHAYDVLTAWGLFMAGKTFEQPEFCEAALKQYGWTQSLQKLNGFFAQASFDQQGDTLSHPLAYVVEGIYEIALITDDPKGIESCLTLLHTLQKNFSQSSFLPGILNQELEAKSTWSCVTGNLQFGWMAVRIGRHENDAELVQWGTKLIKTSAACQRLQSPNPGIRGGVFGSNPIYGDYFPYTTLNWATKYLIDALLEISE